MTLQNDIEAAQLEIDLRTIEADDREELAEEMSGGRVVCSNGFVWGGLPLDENYGEDDEDEMTLTSEGWVMG